MHIWGSGWLDEGDWPEEVAALKETGKIKAFDQSPQDGLYDACREHGVGAIVRVALDEGRAHRRHHGGNDLRRGRLATGVLPRGDRSAEVAKRVDAIAADPGISNEQMAETSLRYVLSHEVVSTVIVGMRSERNVVRNARVADGRGLPAHQVTKLRAHRWDRNFYPG